MEESVERRERRVVRSIVSAIGVGSVTVSMWFPFLPLYLMQIGSLNEADAAFWVAAAIACQGIGRLVAGPVWGLLSDRVGRKKMFVRALFFSAASALIAGLMQAPWQLCIALGLHGVFSGVVPSATALLSVSVADTRMKSALSHLTSMQYIGLSLGPALGATLVLVLGYRGIFFAAASVMCAIGVVVLRAVPADAVPARTSTGTLAVPFPRFRPSAQLLLATFVVFALTAIAQGRQVVAPITLLRLEGANVEALTGLTFTLSALASAAGVFVVARRFQDMPVRRLMIAGCIVAGASHLLLALSDSGAGFIAAYVLCTLLHAALFPLANTLIALNVERERRGTAFGLVTSAQALGMMSGPMAAAYIAASSLAVGFALMGGLLVALAGWLHVQLREPCAAA